MVSAGWLVATAVPPWVNLTGAQYAPGDRRAPHPMTGVLRVRGEAEGEGSGRAHVPDAWTGPSAVVTGCREGVTVPRVGAAGEA